jgi:hypothetical protein
MLWLFAIFWNAVTLPVLVLVSREWQAQGNQLLLLTLIFPAVGLALACAAIYRAIRRRKFGLSFCTIDQVPIEPGRPFQGAIEMRGDTVPDEGYRLLLACVHRLETGHGRNRSVSETPLWHQEVRVSAATAIRIPAGGTRVPFSITIPADARSSDFRIPRDQIIWRLDASAELPGVDYAGSFELPVFATTTSSSDSREIATYRIAHRDGAARRSFVPESGITITPLADGETEYRVRTRGSVRGALVFLVFTLIWLGAIVLMLRENVPLFVPVFFLLIGLILIATAIDYVAGVSIIRAGRNGIDVRRRSLGTGSASFIAAQRIESIDATLGGQSGRSTYYDIVVATSDAGKRTVARYIRNGDDAETLAARLWTALVRDLP